MPCALTSAAEQHVLRCCAAALQLWLSAAPAVRGGAARRAPRLQVTASSLRRTTRTKAATLLLIGTNPTDLSP